MTLTEEVEEATRVIQDGAVKLLNCGSLSEVVLRALISNAGLMGAMAGMNRSSKNFEAVLRPEHSAMPDIVVDKVLPQVVP